jgi:hypothetical protein
VKLDVDFSGAGNTLDIVDKNASELMDALKTQLPQYEVAADPFPWQKEEASHSEEVAVEVNAPSSVVVTNAVGTINFRGPKKVTAGASASPGAPGGQP